MQETERLINEAIKHFADAVVPLYRQRKGMPVHIGTGFFVRCQSRSFLVTAAHVLDEGDGADGRLFYYVGPRVTRDVTGQVVRTRRDHGRDRDLCDVGVVEIVGEEPPYPAAKKAALDVHLLLPNDAPRTGKLYAFVGFPETRNRADRVKREIAAFPYGYQLVSDPGPAYEMLGVTQDSHLVLNFEAEGLLRGVQVKYPKLQGMSGAPIWVLGGESARDWAFGFPIVAIATRHFKREKKILTTDVRHAVRMIGELLSRPPGYEFHRNPAFQERYPS